MNLTKTLTFKLTGLNRDQDYSLSQTQRQFRRCVNFYLHQIAKKQTTTKSDLKPEYQKAKSQYDLPTAQIQQARDFAINQYKSYKNNDENSKFPYFKSFTEVRYDNRSLSFKDIDEEDHKIKISLSTTRGRINAELEGGEYQLNEFQEGDFQDARLYKKNHEYYLNIHVEKSIKIQDAEISKYYIGIDLGVNNLATIAVQNREGEVLETKFFDGSYVGEKRRRFNAKRREYMLKSLWSKLKESRGKEKRFMKDINHKISKYVKDLCKKYEDCTVVMEKLDGIRDSANYTPKQNRRLHNWNFKQLQELISYKAHEVGSAIRRVPPFETSQVCRSCFGKILRSSKNFAIGACETCKKEVLNVDLNAAVNIVKRLWYYLVRDSLESTEPETGLRESSPEDLESESHQRSVDGKGDTAAVEAELQLVSQLSPSLL